MSSFSFSQSWAAQINATGWQYDINGDGLPDSFDDMVGQFQAWAPYLTTALRKRVGRKPIMVANAGAGLSDPMLSGITVEIGTTCPDVSFSAGRCRCNPVSGITMISRCP